MRYLQLNEDGTFWREIPGGNFRFDAHHYCPPDKLTPAEAPVFRVVPLVENAPPAYDPMTQALSRDGFELADGQWQHKWVVTALTAEQQAVKQAEYLANLQTAIVNAVQERLDAFARTRNYDNIFTACTYATDEGHPTFQAEGQYCVSARGATWAKLYEILAEVEAQTRPLPSGYADIAAELPALGWPA